MQISAALEASRNPKQPTPRLVVSDPVTDLRAESLKHDFSEANVVLHIFFLIEEATVAIMQRLWQVPVEERDHRRDSTPYQLIDHIPVILQAFLVYRIVPSAEWNDPRP